MKEEEQKKEAAPQQEFEVRKKNKKSTHSIHVDSSSHAIPPNVKTSFVQAEAVWFNEDESILEFKAVKNELESFVYDIRNNIQEYGNLEKYIDPAVKGDFINKLNQAVDWIYGDGQNASKDQYKQKLAEFKGVGVPIKQRAAFYQDFPIFVDQFKTFQQEVNDKIATANISDQTRSDIINKLGETHQYIDTIL